MRDKRDIGNISEDQIGFFLPPPAFPEPWLPLAYIRYIVIGGSTRLFSPTIPSTPSAVLPWFLGPGEVLLSGTSLASQPRDVGEIIVWLTVQHGAPCRVALGSVAFCVGCARTLFLVSCVGVLGVPVLLAVRVFVK